MTVERSNEEYPDEELMARYVDGDESALSTLIERYFDAIYRYVYRFVLTVAATEDVTQDTFIKVWKYRDSYKKGTALKPWIYRIAHNSAIDYLRKKKQLNFSSLSSEEHPEELFADDAVNILEQSIAREEQERLTAMIEALPSHYKEVVVLRAAEGLSFEEISEVTGKPFNTVRSLYQRGLALLKKNSS